MNDKNPEVIVCNIKRRFTGVSGTINALLPVQAQSLAIGYVGVRIPGVLLAQDECGASFTWLTLFQAIALSRRPLDDGRRRIWHVRRDPEMLLGIILRDLFRLPIALVFTSAAKRRHSWFPRWLISRMDGVVSTTPEAASHVPNTTRVVPHGISLERFEPPANKLEAWADGGLPGRYGVGVFGRVRPEKGTDIFVEAMLRVLPEFPDYCAVLAGLAQPQHEAFQADLQERIRVSGLSERIRFLGELAPDQVSHWYQRVLIAVACPRREAFGLTPLEGMACGCAVVATDTGAFREIVDEAVTGFVVPIDDIEALADRLRKLMGNPRKTVEMGQRGRARVARHFSVEGEAAGLAEVYAEVWRRTRAVGLRDGP